MNRTKIEWTDYTWNPVTGCWGPGGTPGNPRRCAYCYAERMMGRIKAMQGTGHKAHDFSPFFWNVRLGEPGRLSNPAKIFVCSMGDLFGASVPARWIKEVLGVAWDNPQHIFQFLTKNPERLHHWNPWPKNAWVGTTITNQADMNERGPWLLRVDAPVLFVSHEPLLGAINTTTGGPSLFPWDMASGQLQQQTANIGITYWVNTQKINWAIIGAMTGPGAVKPTPKWVRDLWEQYRQAETPVFMKDNLKPIMGTLVQEFPQ